MKAAHRRHANSATITTLLFASAGNGRRRMHAGCRCREQAVLPLKVAAIGLILAAGALGVLLPMLGGWFPSLRSERDLFFVVKAFAAGVILATGLVHVLPDAFENLTSPCLGEGGPWQEFPFALLPRERDIPQRQPRGRGPCGRGGRPRGHLHTHASHGHAHGPVLSPPPLPKEDTSDQIRHRVISQVLELGIVVHSVIIGISLGASTQPSTVRPLLGALSFHQFFEGLGLGGCIAQVGQVQGRAAFLMALFFTLTTPVGVALGIGVAAKYDENGGGALIVEGLLNAASAGILIYMALVDLLAADFMSPKLRSHGRLQLAAYLALFLGAGLMSLLAKWA
ncbi:unnamed protein product [Spirodela intermedia]|uniref:Uncharacterized protein n=1 Tax=Spirodela intermedia TaxID=51605 RepID=A0A7I8JP49_SPIIN|nr:unnamed protein product [Spirodela intermedia]CAA6671880.1 unnamed protein product [Spirodela intermedia]